MTWEPQDVSLCARHFFFFNNPESPLTTGVPSWLETSFDGIQATNSSFHCSCEQGGQSPLLASLVKAPAGHPCFGGSRLSGSTIFTALAEADFLGHAIQLSAWLLKVPYWQTPWPVAWARSGGT